MCIFGAFKLSSEPTHVVKNINSQNFPTDNKYVESPEVKVVFTVK